MVQATFDYEAGQAAKEQGLDRACSPFYRRQLLCYAQVNAYNIAKERGMVTFDDVYHRMVEKGLMNPALLGAASGAVFKGEGWECIGWKASERVTNHKRPIRIWRLR
jgi:hypothetical protein